MHTPGATGGLVYLNADPDLDLVAKRVKKPAKVPMPKTLIDKNGGYMTFFTDTERNKIGLH
jgi:predicted enzyme related to lactoylglutathione lyase